MRIGIQFDTRRVASAATMLGDFERAEAEGFDTVWIGQIFSHDVLTLFAMAGLRTERIELGTSVVPLPTRHVVTLAQQALTTQLATGNRLCLGVGSGHAMILDKKLGLPNDHPLGRTREALEVLHPLLRGEYVKYAGEFEQVRVDTPVEGVEPPPVILAALGPKMIELAGERTDGVTVVFAGPDFIAEHVTAKLPTGKRIVASLPVMLTHATEPMCALMDEYTAPSMALPPYQRTMGAQGFERASQIAIAGNEQAVEAGLDRLAASGVTDLNPILIAGESDPRCADRTRAFLAERARKARGEA